MPPEPEGVARIVEVGAKQMTDREAVAECVVSMTPDACAQLGCGRGAQPLRHGEGVRPRGAHRRSASAREERWQERRLHGRVSLRRPIVVTLLRLDDLSSNLRDV